MQKFGQIYSMRIGGTTYIGKAVGSALSRWAAHIRLLRDRRHHCRALQDAFDTSGLEGVTFSILRDKVPEDLLTHEEHTYTKKFDSVNALPGHVVREQKALQVLSDIKNGIKYRDISANRGVSLGYIASVKAKTHERANNLNATCV